MVSADDFVDGSDVKIQALTTTIVGSVLLAVYHRLIGFTLSIGAGISSTLEGTSEFLAMAVSTLVGGPAAVVDSAVAGFSVEQLEIFAFAVSLFGVVLILYGATYARRWL